MRVLIQQLIISEITMLFTIEVVCSYSAPKVAKMEGKEVQHTRNGQTVVPSTMKCKCNL